MQIKLQLGNGSEMGPEDKLRSSKWKADAGGADRCEKRRQVQRRRQVREAQAGASRAGVMGC